MDLLSSTTLRLNLKPSLFHNSRLSASTPLSERIRPIREFTSFQRLTFASRQFSLRISSTRRTLAQTQRSIHASAVALDTDKDKLPADIEVTETEEPSSRVRLTVKVPSVVCEDCYKNVIMEITKQSKVPGFRPGKNVPETILVNYVGKKNVQRATIESILKRTLPHAMSSLAQRLGCSIVTYLTRVPIL